MDQTKLTEWVISRTEHFLKRIEKELSTGNDPNEIRADIYVIRQIHEHATQKMKGG